jgi:glycosyltransferase involved in cell wall biosynthesis
MSTATGRSRPRVAIVHDYLTQRGGAERVALLFCRMFPDAPLYTSLYDSEETFPEFSNIDVRTSWLNRIEPLRLDHRRALPLLAPVFSSMRIDADVVLCSSSGWAHGVSALGRKVVYCYAPARWLYQTHRYVYGSKRELQGRSGGVPTRGDGMARALVKYSAAQALAPPLRLWDRRAARMADRYLTTSSAVAQDIAAVYGMDAAVIPPPSTFEVDGPLGQPVGVKPDFVLCVSRLLPYKNVDAVVAGAKQLGKDLIVVGDGPELSRLRKGQSATTRFLGNVDDATLRWLYTNCRALVAVSYEDYGLTPIEAACFGKPTVALRRGGYLDTVQDRVTGVLVESPTPEAVASGLRRLEDAPLDERTIRNHGETYTYANFESKIRAVIDDGGKLSTRNAAGNQ